MSYEFLPLVPAAAGTQFFIQLGQNWIPAAAGMSGGWGAIRAKNFSPFRPPE